MVLRNVNKQFTFEEQRQEINEIAVDLDAINFILSSVNVSNWDAAYSWGNHASAGYLTSVSLLGLTDVEITPPGGPGFLPLDEGHFLTYTNGKWRNVQGITTGDPIVALGGIEIEKIVGGPYLNGLISFVGGAGISIGYGTNPTGNAGQVITADGNGGIQWSNVNITETDPIFVASPAGSITITDITNWDTAYSWSNHATAGYWVKDVAKISNWDTAYSWGDHANAGYLTSYTETDPIFNASPSKNITNTEISNWNTAYSWGNHSTVGYLTSYTEIDPIFAASPAATITNTNKTNWDTAYSWGNHATAGYITGISNLSIDALNDVAITSPASGQVLSYNSSTGLWENSAPTGAGGGSGTPGGLNTQVQFNDNGVLSGDSGFTYSKSTKVLDVSIIQSSINTNRVIESALLKSDSLSGSNGATVYLQNNAVYYYTTNASGDWTVDVRNSPSISTLHQLIGVGDSLTFVILATQGSTAYRNTTFKIDNSVVVPKWSGGTAFPGGNANSIDVYTYTIIRTGDNATIQWTVLASRNKFA